MPSPHLHLGLDPGPHDVGLAGELPPEVLVGLLLALLVEQRVVPLGHQLLDLRGARGQRWEPPPGGRDRPEAAAPSPGGVTHPLPLGVDDLGGDGGVGVVAPQLDAVEVGDALRLALDAQDGLALLVGVGQGGLELVVGGDEALRDADTSSEAAPGGSQPSSEAPPAPPHLDLLDGVDDEHVLQVLHGALHPVVEGSRPLGVLQVQLVDRLQLLLRFLRGRGGVRRLGGDPWGGPGPRPTSRASLLLWVREPSTSHWSQIFWHRALTLGES